MKVIFLDIDGVLNDDTTTELTTRGTLFVSENHLFWLKKIISETGAKIVLTSTWRKGLFDIVFRNAESTDACDYRELVLRLYNYGIEFFSATPMSITFLRGAEIEMFLNSWTGEKIDNFVIIDDIDDVRPFQNRQVHIDGKIGLDQKAAELAIQMLNTAEDVAYSKKVSVVFDEGVTCVPQEEFRDHKDIAGVQFPHSLQVIAKRAFAFCPNLEEVLFSHGIRRIEKEAFFECGKLKQISLPDSVEQLGVEVFSGCAALQQVKISQKLQELPYGVFMGCAIANINLLPSRVETIHSNAFANCSQLQEVYLPQCLKKVDALAFHNCEKLERVYVAKDFCNFDENAFKNCPKFKGFLYY